MCLRPERRRAHRAIRRDAATPDKQGEAGRRQALRQLRVMLPLLKPNPARTEGWSAEAAPREHS